MNSPFAIRGDARVVKRVGRRLDVQVVDEGQVWESFKGASTSLYTLLRLVSTIIAVAAVLGLMNMMFTIVKQRKQEVATLRSVGFGRRAVVAYVLALSGASLFLRGLQVEAIGITMEPRLAPTIALRALGLMAAIGLLAGGYPALLVTRLNLAEALRGELRSRQYNVYVLDWRQPRMKPIYLDYNATTPIAPEVAEAMVPYLYEQFGNPSSSHPYGVTTKRAVEVARAQVAELLGCQSTEVIFTSGGTESNNLAIKGVALADLEQKGHIITSAVEHPAVVEVCNWLETQGFRITVLPVDKYGLVNPVDLERAITPDTLLVTLLHANNEVGTVQPIAELAEIAHRHGALMHTDAAQSVGKMPVKVDTLGVDLLSVAGHKLYAPKGIGALYIRSGVQLVKILHGAGQEGGRRPGTENVLEIVGLGQACQVASRDLDKNRAHFWAMRDRLHEGLLHKLGDGMVRLNGHPEKRLPNTLSLSFRDVEANRLLSEIGEQVAASAGSACHADQVDMSSVLKAMEVEVEWGMGTVRFSVGRSTTTEEVERAVGIVTEAVRRLQS